ncbi:MAG: GntR family transcriptional regulator [Bauldia sp.]|nr:GntR family transcriptional regulator [Bauldia sp.]
METLTDKRRIAVEPLGRETLQDRVYNHIAGLILDGGIAPGQLVTIQALAEAFGVSAMPVREALKRLTAANALTVVSGRSIGIPRLSLDRLVDLRNVRIEVEGTAAAWAAEAITPAGLRQLEDQLERMNRSIPAGDTRDYLRANRAFHFAIYRASNSPTIVGLIEILWLQISPYFNLLRESGNYVSANLHHRAMVEALARKDGPAARAAIVADVTGSFEVLERIVV